MLLLCGPHLTLGSKGLGISTFLTYWYLRGNKTKLKFTVFLPKPDSLPLEFLLIFATMNSPPNHRVIWVSFFSLPLSHPNQFWTSSDVSHTHLLLFTSLLLSGLRGLPFLSALPALPVSTPPNPTLGTTAILFILFYFWLCWVFTAVHGLSRVVVSRGYSSLQCAGFSLKWLLMLQSTGSSCPGFSSCGARAQ